MYLPDTKIEKATAKGNGSRPMLEQVYYDAEKSRVMACDGFVLAVVPVESSEDDLDFSGPLTDQALKMARQGGKSASRKIDFDNGNYVFESGATLPRPAGPHTYPDVDAIIPKDGDERVKVCLSAKRLYDLAQAVCASGDKDLQVELSIDAEHSGTRPVLVKALNNEDATGVIMPVSNGR